MRLKKKKKVVSTLFIQLSFRFLCKCPKTCSFMLRSFSLFSS